MNLFILFIIKRFKLNVFKIEMNKNEKLKNIYI